MKLVVAYCKLLRATEEAVLASIDELDEVIWADTSSSDTAYFELLAEHWALGSTFVVLEQDKIPDGSALRELHDCPEGWCTYPFPMADGSPAFRDFPTLGCTKFSAEIMRSNPHLPERVGKLRAMGLLADPKRLDMAIAVQLGRRVKPHWHEDGRVDHRHEHPAGVSA